MPRRARFLLVVSWLAAATASAALPTAERVRVPSLDRSEGAPAEIEALVFRPAGDAGLARPAVIALHGCGGMYRTAKGHEDELSERYASRAQALIDAGYVVMFPDSLRSRGLQGICMTPGQQREATPTQRRLDALAALRWLAAQPGIARDRIALLGWSHGGNTVLATLDESDDEVMSFIVSGRPPLFFHAAVAFYPGCEASLRRARWRPAAPVIILIGGQDDWVPAAPCEELAARAEARRWPLETVVYAGAHHGFDTPGGEVRHLKRVRTGVNPGKGVHVGPEPAAREDANRRIDAFLRDAPARPSD